MELGKRIGNFLAAAEGSLERLSEGGCSKEALVEVINTHVTYLEDFYQGTGPRDLRVFGFAVGLRELAEEYGVRSDRLEEYFNGRKFEENLVN